MTAEEARNISDNYRARCNEDEFPTELYNEVITKITRNASKGLYSLSLQYGPILFDFEIPDILNLEKQLNKVAGRLMDDGFDSHVLSMDMTVQGPHSVGLDVCWEEHI